MSTMVRINASIRDHVIRGLLDKKFVKEVLELEELQQKMDEAEASSEKLAYEACFSKATIKILNEAQVGFFPTASYCMIRIEKGGIAGNYSDEKAHFNEDKPVPYRNSFHVGQFANVITDEHPYVKARAKYKELKKEYETKDYELRQAKRSAQARAETILSSVTTVKRLVEVWPEVQEFLPELVSGPEGNLPAEVIADVNKFFGLK